MPHFNRGVQIYTLPSQPAIDINQRVLHSGQAEQSSSHSKEYASISFPWTPPNMDAGGGLRFSRLSHGISANPRNTPSVQFQAKCIPFPTNIYCSKFLETEETDQRRCGMGLEVLRRAALEVSQCGIWRFSLPTCHPDTRRETLDTLSGWASELAIGAGSIIWLHGPMGAGKSAVLQTLTHRLHSDGRLGASFVFRREPSGNAHILFSAIAYQLATNVPRLRGAISRAARRNPGIVGESLATQLHELILEPCRAVADFKPLTIVIDGLDQCRLEDQQEILALLGNAARSSQLRFLLGSKSENYAAEFLADPQFSAICRSFCVERSFEDVRTYLYAEFARIQQDCLESSRGDCSPSSWISTHSFNILVGSSSGCFLYASTLVKFLGDPEFLPQTRLSAVIDRIPLNLLNSPLDILYTQILATVPTRLRTSLLATLHILTTKPFAHLPLHHMEQLLHTKTGRLRRILRHLRSVLNVPDSDHGGSITAHHDSFLDFLVDPARSGAFCVIGSRYSMYLVRSILKSLAYSHKHPQVNRVGHIAW
ncbi:hypothetical protein B0H15DRAFT_594971 [Mycena belliarum]|uniref:Nephrocystin 3-like N-terminal domain-containing protein n=1 Tax=Mycena belliarum TaxID=1033014 RepID=A0AAD6TR25_9AGAR|nr:hypothetical protein B0H15DRAFT_594971 [Mycena belliae]